MWLDNIALFLPTRYSGLLLWLRADLGITATSAAVSASNDVTAAAWTKSNCTAPNFQTLQDSNDGAPTTHVIFQAASNLQTGHAATFRLEAKAGTKTWIRMTDSAGNLAAYVNLSTGAVGAHTGTVTVTPLADSWFAISIFDVCQNSALNIGLANGDGALSYQGNGTGTILVRNIAIDQKNVSTWADQSGNGNNLTQGTAAKQPLWTPSDATMNGRESVGFDGVDDFLTRAASYAQPNHVFAAARNNGSSAAYHTLCDGSASNQRILRVEITTQAIVTLANTTPLSDGTWPTSEKHVAEGVFNGGSSAIYKDGAETLGAGGTGSATGFSLGALADGVTNPWQGPIAEFIVYDRVLTATERKVVEKYLGQRYEIAVAA